MLDRDHAVVEIDVFNLQTQDFTDPAAQTEQEANQQFIPQIGGCFLHQGYFAWLQVRPHAC
jgi:hypothetical protein